jgi:hypothetical protein
MDIPHRSLRDKSKTKKEGIFYILAPYSWKRPCCGRENSFGKASSFQGKRWRGKVISDKTLSELGIHVRF